MAVAYLLSAKVAMDLLRGDVPSAQPVKRWMESGGRTAAHVSALGLAWVRSDIQKIADPVQRARLTEEFDLTLGFRYASRTVLLDEAALRQWSVIRNLEHGGKALTTEDALEIAMALANDMIYVGERSKLREKTGVVIEDPWDKS